MRQTIYRLAMTLILVSLVVIKAPLYASEMDTRIESSAKESYVFKTYLKDDDITIKSKDGVVTLTGTVSDESHISLAQETVASLPGVTGVENKLEGKGESPAANTDAWLISKVQAALLFHRNLNATETEVMAKDGIVTLRGEAINAAQKDLATEYAKDVDGVKEVKNEMTVSTTGVKPTTGTKTTIEVKPTAETKSAQTTMGQKLDTVEQKMEIVGEKMGVVGQKIGAITESIDDASITALVKSTLLYHRSTSAINTTVKTKDGVVTLGGKALNAAEKDLATKYVSDIYGVKTVVNNMTVD